MHVSVLDKKLQIIAKVCQICGCISIPTQSLDCQNLITPPAQGSLTGRFLTLKSNPEIRWLNLIYVDFMCAGPLSPWHSSKHRAKASSLQSWNLLFERFNYLKKILQDRFGLDLKGEQRCHEMAEMEKLRNWRHWPGWRTFTEIQKRHLKPVHHPGEPLTSEQRPRQLLRIGTIKQQALHRQAEFNEILNVRKALTCTFGHRARSCGRRTRVVNF